MNSFNQKDRRRKSATKGYALLIALLIIAVLSGMVTEFMFSTKVHAELSANWRDQLKARYLARSAINTVQYLLELNQLKPGQLLYGLSSWVGYGSSLDNVEEGELVSAFGGLTGSPISPIPSGHLKGQWGINLPTSLFDLDGEVFGRVINERGKINLNAIVRINPQDRMSDSRNEEVYNVLYTLLQLRGVDSNEIAGLLDSLVDWIDGNSSVEPQGAEDDYYRGLDSPYYPRNDLLVSVDELMLVKGWTPEIFELVKDFVTVYPTQGSGNFTVPDYRVDFTSAPKLVLIAIFLSFRPSVNEAPINDADMASLVADDIYAKALERASLAVNVGADGKASISAGQTLSASEIQSVIAGRLQGNISYFIYDYRETDPLYYTAIGAGKVNQVLSTIEVVFKYAQNKVEILRWKEE